MECAPSYVAGLQPVATNDARPVPAKNIRVEIPRIPTLGIGGFLYMRSIESDSSLHLEHKVQGQEIVYA